METVYCQNCEYGTENNIEGNWAFECPECGQENIIVREEN